MLEITHNGAANVTVQSTTDYPPIQRRFSNTLTLFRPIKSIDTNLPTASSRWFSHRTPANPMVFGRFAKSLGFWRKSTIGVVAGGAAVYGGWRMMQQSNQDRSQELPMQQQTTQNSYKKSKS